MNDVYILAIETSCDETSMAIVKNGREIDSLTILTQMDTHANFGGVVPEIASRMHTENITMVLEETLKKSSVSIKDIAAIAVTYAPGLLGSLLVGIECAKTLSLVYNKPLIAVNHTMGHIYANNIEHEIVYPTLALIVSGGHTDMLILKNETDMEVLGSTMDDSIGEVYDKVARVLGMPYPGGPAIENNALEGEDTYPLPKPMNDNSYNFSFSGLKSAVINLVHNEKQRNQPIRKKDLATSFQNTVVKIISKKTMKALKDYQVKNLIIAGGVAANHGIRETLTTLCEQENITCSVPDIKYCTDNAAMIAASGYYAYRLGRVGTLDLNPKSSIVLK